MLQRIRLAIAKKVCPIRFEVIEVKPAIEPPMTEDLLNQRLDEIADAIEEMKR